MRKIIAGVFLFTVLLAIGMLFWNAELKYTRPTPIPKGYREVTVNEKVFVNDTLNQKLEKPVFYHFFTTNCPCSRFNLNHFNHLKQQYGAFIDFYVVVPEEDDLTEARKYFSGETRIIRDRNKQLALRSGVYSTPQAVIINTDHRLYFRGNYNKARYCTDPFSNFAQMAIDSLASHNPPPDFGHCHTSPMVVVLNN